MAGGLHVAFPTLCVGGQVCGEDHRLVVEVEVHARVVDQGGFVDVDVEAVVALHLQGGLHARGREGGLRRVGRDGLLHVRADLGETRLGVVVLLGVVVPGDPECRVVARHGKLRPLLADGEVGELLLLGKLVAESESFVVEAEADGHLAARFRLAERYGHLVIVVADRRLLAPDRLPLFVERGAFDAGLLEAVVERYGGAIAALFDFGSELQRRCIAAQLEPHGAGQHGGTPPEVEGIGRGARFGEAEGEFQVAVGREQGLLRRGAGRGKQGGQQRKYSFHRDGCGLSVRRTFEFDDKCLTGSDDGVVVHRGGLAREDVAPVVQPFGDLGIVRPGHLLFPA